MPKDLKGFQKGHKSYLTTEIIKKISDSNRGKTRSLEFREKSRKRMMGEKNPSKIPSVRKKMSEAHKGKKLSEETKRKIGEKHKGNKNVLGKHWKLSEKTKAKLSKIKKENPVRYWLGKKMPFNEKKMGENHWRWIKDRSLLKKRDERNDSAYHSFVRECKKRDKVCKMKNDDCMGYLIVHHILSWRDYPKLRYIINNGITLCQFHHPRKRVEEQKLIPLFQSLVEVK